MALAERVFQAPTRQRRVPFALFRQEAAFTGAQPALAVVFANADVDIAGRDVHVAHDHDAVGGGMLALQCGQHCAVKSRLGGKFQRMGAAFALGEIRIVDMDVATGGGEAGLDEAPLRVLAVVRKSAGARDGRSAEEQRNTVVTLLAMVDGLVAEPVYVLQGKLIVRDLGFLEADHIRRMPDYNLFQLMRSCSYPIDIKANNFHASGSGGASGELFPAPRQKVDVIAEDIAGLL